MKRFFTLLLAFSFLGALAGCSGEPSEGSPSPAASESAAASASASASANSDEPSEKGQMTERTLEGLNYSVDSAWPEETTVFEQSTTSSYDTGTGTIVINASPMDEGGAEFAGQVETATEEENAAIGLAPVDVPGAVSAWEIAPSQVDGDENRAQTLAVTIFSNAWIYTVSYTTDQAESDAAEAEWANLLSGLSVSPENEQQIEADTELGEAIVIEPAAEGASSDADTASEAVIAQPEGPEESAQAAPAAEGAQEASPEAAAEASAEASAPEEPPAE